MHTTHCVTPQQNRYVKNPDFFVASGLLAAARELNHALLLARDKIVSQKREAQRPKRRLNRAGFQWHVVNLLLYDTLKRLN